MADLKITDLGAGTPKSTDLHVAVDTTDSSMAPTGTDKKYTLSDISSFILGNAAKFVTAYVSSTGGTDTATSGSVVKPYASLAYTLSQITDATSTKIYIIKMSGVFSDATIQLKPWIFIDGQDSILTITNPVVLHSSYVTLGGMCILQNFSNLNTIAGLNLDFTSCPDSQVLLKNFISSSSVSWIIKGDTTSSTIAIVEEIFGLSSSPSLTIQNCYGGLVRCATQALTILATSVTNSYNITVEESQVFGAFLAESDAGANLSINTNSNTLYGGLTIKSLSAAPLVFIQNADAILSSLTIDGTGISYKTDSRQSAITLLNGATVASNVIYRTLSDGITANYTPVNYTPVNPQVQGHLHGIDNALAGVGTGFLVAANNLSDVVSASTSRTNLGLGTMAIQNAASVAITGGTINGTTIGATTASTVRATAITETTFATAGIVHNAAGGLFSSSLIVNADVSASAAIVDTKLATISTALKVSNSATTAVSTNTINAIVARDGSGNFAANIITATLSGTATNFSGSLVGDVTGTQGATVIAADAVTNAKMANMPAHTFKGNNTAGSTNPLDLTIAQMQAELGVGSATLLSTHVGFGSGSNLLTGSANLTWDGTIFTTTGAHVITSSLNVATTATGVGAYIGIGQPTGSTGIIFSQARAAGAWFSGSTIGDGCIRQLVTSNFLLLGIGSGVPQIKISSGGVQLNSGTLSASSTFTVFSTTQGTRPNPSMTTAQRTAIASPATNLQVFDTTLGQGMFYDGTAWMIMY